MMAHRMAYMPSSVEVVVAVVELALVAHSIAFVDIELDTELVAEK